MVVLGVDPGGSATGICGRDGRTVVFVSVVERRRRPMAVYLRAVLDEIERAGRELSWECRLAVEDLVEPNPHVRLANVRGLLDTAQVLGAVTARWPSRRLVRPNRHGSAPLFAYPSELVGPTERTGTGGRLRHARSAFDVAGATYFHPLDDESG